MYNLRICNRVNLMGKTDPAALPYRRWLSIGFDRGADPRQMIKESQRGTKELLGRIHLIPDPGHTYFAMLRLVLELLYALGVGIFASSFGFEKPGSQDYLESGRNIHKTIQFLYCFMEAFTLAAIRQWKNECGSDGSAVSFDAWLDDHKNCVTFKSNAFLLRKIFPAIRCIIRSQRINNMSMFMAGCKVLINLSFMLGKHMYGNGLLDEWSEIYKLPLPVLKQRLENFSPLGQPFG